MKDTADTATGVKEKEGESGEKNGKSKGGKRQSTPRKPAMWLSTVIRGARLSNLMKHFEQMLPDYVGLRQTPIISSPESRSQE